MLIEKLIFNVLAFALFILIFFNMIRKNDTGYLIPLIIQAVGIAINFFELIFMIHLNLFFRIIMYLLSVILPIIILLLEKRGINFLELIYILFSKIALTNKDTKAAKTFLIKLVSKYPDSYYGHKLLGEVYEKEGGMRKAIEEYVKAIDLNKKDYDTYYKIAHLLDELNQKEESTTMLQNLLKIKPDYYEASYLLGEILMEQEHFKEAINIYMEALKYNPNNYDLYYSLGMAYTRLNDFQNAKICYERAATLNTLLYQAQYNLAQIALIYDDLDEAEKYFNECLEDENLEAESYYHLARIAILKGNNDKAVNYLNLAIELKPILIKKADKEPLFLPIRKFIRIPDLAATGSEGGKKKRKLKVQEKNATKHLEKTYELTRKLSKNELKELQRNTKGVKLERKNKQIEIKDEREKE